MLYLWQQNKMLFMLGFNFAQIDLLVKEQTIQNHIWVALYCWFHYLFWCNCDIFLTCICIVPLFCFIIIMRIRCEFGRGSMTMHYNLYIVRLLYTKTNTFDQLINTFFDWQIHRNRIKINLVGLYVEIYVFCAVVTIFLIHSHGCFVIRVYIFH